MSTSEGKVHVLSGDCGGTNTRLSLWEVERGARTEQGHKAPGVLVCAKKFVTFAPFSISLSRTLFHVFRCS